MFYDPRQGPRPYPLSHNPFNALIAPRPIGWISTRDGSGRFNLAPFSYFAGISADPPMVAFAPNSKDLEGRPKDTLRNVLDVPEFVVNLATYELRESVVLTSEVYPHGISEFQEAGLTAAPGVNVSVPRVGESPAALECTVFDTLELPAGPNKRQSVLVVGEVVGIYIEDRVIKDGLVDQLALQQLARLGYFHYSHVTNVFDMQRPK